MKECYNILNYAVDQLYPDLDATEITKNEPKKQKRQKLEDGEEKKKEGHQDDLEAELEEIKQHKAKIWYSFPTGTVGINFIKMLDCFKPFICVTEIAEFIIKKLTSENKEDQESIQSRFICRFLPIQFMCKASGNMDEFKRLSVPHIEQYLNKTYDESSHFSWCVEWKSKNNQKLNRNDYIEALKTMFHKASEEKKLSYSIDYKLANFDVLVEAYRDIMLVGFIKEYKARKKYNLQMLQVANIGNKKGEESEEEHDKKKDEKKKDKREKAKEASEQESEGDNKGP